MECILPSEKAVHMRRSQDCFPRVPVRGFQNLGYLFGCPHNKDFRVVGSIVGSPYLGKLISLSRISSSSSISCPN